MRPAKVAIAVRPAVRTAGSAGICQGEAAQGADLSRDEIEAGSAGWGPRPGDAQALEQREEARMVAYDLRGRTRSNTARFDERRVSGHPSKIS